MFAGLPGAGKSTRANLFQSNNLYEIISSDDLRARIYGDINDQTHNKELFTKIIPEQITQAICEKKNVIYDATNICKRDRSSIIKLATQLNVPIECWCFEPDIEECKKRNATRARKVPEWVIDRMAAKWETPSLDEGFSCVVNLNLEKQKRESALDKLTEETERLGLYDKITDDFPIK